MPLQTKEQGHIFAATLAFAQSSTPSTIRKSRSAPFLRTASAAWYSGLSCAAIAYEHGVKERTVVVEFEPRQSMPVEAFDGPANTYMYPDLRIRIRDEINRRNIWRYLNSEPGRRYLQERATGTAGNMP
jgi:hypothetical protein